MEELLDGLVPGLPDDAAGEIRDRAEGVPLYAVETVRMLLDRGLLAQRGGRLPADGPIETLDVPETLHALIAARLDGLDAGGAAAAPGRRRARQDFTQRGLAALSGHATRPSSSRCSRALVRKEVLSRPGRSALAGARPVRLPPGLLKRVAYETLVEGASARRSTSRPPRYLEQAFGERAGDRGGRRRPLPRRLPGGAECRRRGRDQGEGREMLTRAGERAASLAANDEAQRYFEQAAELAEEPLAEAALRERAGETPGRADGPSRRKRTSSGRSSSTRLRG